VGVLAFNSCFFGMTIVFVCGSLGTTACQVLLDPAQTGVLLYLLCILSMSSFLGASVAENHRRFLDIPFCVFDLLL